ncbi:Alpha/Beta hydrolase protein [Xylariaceae sp. FL1019]|nr:Alpha/Beta hydrolase protein [Xylariaceae sp. FL1019]
MDPLLVLVPGAFGTAEGFEKMIPYLGSLETHPASYPSCNPPDPLEASCTNDIATLRSTLISLLDQGRNLIILAHSYAGVVAGGAAKGLDPISRNGAGHECAVLGLIYVVGNITLEGETLLDAVGGAYPPFIKSNTPSEGLALVDPANEVFYNDCEPDPMLDKYVYPHALKAFETKAPAPAWKDPGFEKRILYIRTGKDQCNPPFLQNLWIEKSGVEWKIVDIDTGHMPFVSQPEECAKHVVHFVGEIAEL